MRQTRIQWWGCIGIYGRDEGMNESVTNDWNAAFFHCAVLSEILMDYVLLYI
jgi:hypothetical protein